MGCSAWWRPSKGQCAVSSNKTVASIIEVVDCMGRLLTGGAPLGELTRRGCVLRMKMPICGKALGSISPIRRVKSLRLQPAH